MLFLVYSSDCLQHAIDSAVVVFEQNYTVCAWAHRITTFCVQKSFNQKVESDLGFEPWVVRRAGQSIEVGLGNVAFGETWVLEGLEICKAMVSGTFPNLKSWTKVVYNAVESSNVHGIHKHLDQD